MKVKELIAKLQKFSNWKAVKDAPFPGPAPPATPAALRPMMIEKATGREVPVPDFMLCARCGRPLLGMHRNSHMWPNGDWTANCDDCEPFVVPGSWQAGDPLPAWMQDKHGETELSSSEWSLDNLPPYLVLTGKKLLMLDPSHRTAEEIEVFYTLLMKMPRVLPGEDSYGNPRH